MLALNWYDTIILCNSNIQRKVSVPSIFYYSGVLAVPLWSVIDEELAAEAYYFLSASYWDPLIGQVSQSSVCPLCFALRRVSLWAWIILSIDGGYVVVHMNMCHVVVESSDWSAAYQRLIEPLIGQVCWSYYVFRLCFSLRRLAEEGWFVCFCVLYVIGCCLRRNIICPNLLIGRGVSASYWAVAWSVFTLSLHSASFAAGAATIDCFASDAP